MTDPDPGRRSNAFGHRRDVWGDDPEEVEATRVIEEFASDRGVQRAWHEHPAWAPFKVVWLFIRRSGRRIAVTVAGFAVLIIGIILIPLPGPGWAIVFGGLAILATEYVWAQRVLNYAKRKAVSAKNAVLRQKPAEEVTPEP
jgi:uncharacterized protein (TIGR02611 family)